MTNAIVIVGGGITGAAAADALAREVGPDQGSLGGRGPVP